MASQEVRVELHSVVGFSDGRQTKKIYENSNPPTKDGMVVLIDASGSMRDFQGEMKLCASALKCITSTQGRWNLPEPSGCTALVDAVDAIVAMNLDGVTKIVVLTDGEDTSSKVTRLIKAFDVNGTPEFQDMPPRPHKWQAWLDSVKKMPYNKYYALSDLDKAALMQQYTDYTKASHDRRNEAVALHLSHIGVEIHITGIGKEVKDFVATCAKAGPNIYTAHVEKGASAESIGAIVATSVRRSRGGSRDTVTATNATQLSAQQTKAIEAEARRTSTHSERRINQRLLRDGPSYDPSAEERYVRFIVDKEATKTGLDRFKAEILNIVLWFRKNCLDDDHPIAAGAIVGGRFWPKDPKTGRRSGSVFEPPNDAMKPSLWCNTIGRILELLSRDPQWIYERVEGLGEAFREEIGNGIVGPLFHDEGQAEASYIAIYKKHLSGLKGRALYYKFKADTYTHFRRCDRAEEFDPPIGDLTTLSIVGRGFSGPDSYGGPHLSPEDIGAPPAPSASSPGCGSSKITMSGIANPLKSLKRKIGDLEEDK